MLDDWKFYHFFWQTGAHKLSMLKKIHIQSLNVPRFVLHRSLEISRRMWAVA